MVWDASGSSPPLAVLPFGLGFGAWQSLGPGRRGLVAVGGVLAVTRVTLYRVFGGGGCLQPPGSGRRSNHAARLVPERGPRAAAVRDAGAVLAPAGIPGFSSQPLSPLSAAPAARGGFVPPSPWECSLLGGGFGFQLAAGGDIDLWDFPAVPFSQQLCSSREAEVGVQPPQPGYFNQVLCWPLLPPGAFAACPGAVPIPVPSPRPPPAAHTGSSVVETLFWSSKHCKSYSRRAGGFPGVFPSASFPAVSRLGTEQRSAVFTRALGCCRPNSRVLFPVGLTKY